MKAVCLRARGSEARRTAREAHLLAFTKKDVGGCVKGVYDREGPSDKGHKKRKDIGRNSERDKECQTPCTISTQSILVRWGSHAVPQVHLSLMSLAGSGAAAYD